MAYFDELTEDEQAKVLGSVGREESKDNIKTRLKEQGLKVTVRNRKLSSGPKYFFVVDDDEGNLWQSSNSIRKLIREYFPRAHLTSGGSFSRTYAEY